MCGSGAVSCSCSLLIRGPILPAVRQKLHLSPCADSRNRLYRRQNHSTFFLRNRAELELMRRLATRASYGSIMDIAVFACSKGAEVYSIAWTLKAARPDLTINIRANQAWEGRRQQVPVPGNCLGKVPRASISEVARGVERSTAPQRASLEWRAHCGRLAPLDDLIRISQAR